MEQNQTENNIISNNNENNNENNNINNNINNNDNISNSQLKNEILDFGFDAEKIDIAMKISNNKEEIINLIVQMMEQPEFYNQLKSQTSHNQNSLNTQIINYFNQQPQQYKMVIVVRTDLNMSLGKISAQVGHAVLGAYKLSLQNDITKTNNWENFSGQAKIVLGVSNKEELFEIQKKAKEAGLITCLIHDAGRTQVAPNTPTCCAIGPDIVENIDKITGKLKLL